MSGMGRPQGGVVPVSFKRVWYVNQAGATGVNFYAKINDAIAAILNLPIAQRPSQSEPQVVIVHPGVYPEKIWLPDYVWIQGSGVIGMSIITGGSDVILDDVVVSIGIGGLMNFVAFPSGTSGQPDTTIFSRNSTSIYTADESDYGTINNGDTLIITPDGQSQETITFAGTEVTANQVATTINAQAVNFSAQIRFNRAELIHNTTPISNGLTLHKEGTANAALGFYTDADTISSVPIIEIQVVKNVWVFNFGGTNGILLTDQGGGSYLLSDVKIYGGINGIHCEPDSVVEIGNPICAAATNGLYIEDGAKMTINGGASSGNTQDILFGTGGTGELVARSFAYKKRSGSGILTPSGSRITFEWNLSGGIAVSTLIDSARPIMYNCTIESVTLWRGSSGISGSTIVDVNMAISGGSFSTLYSTQANRPSVIYTLGNNVVALAALPDTINLIKGRTLSIDVDAKEGGAPQNLNLTITAVVN